MALNVFELFGTIAVDNSGAERSIDKTVGHARDAESKLEKTFKRIGTVVAAAFTIDKIVDFGKACTQAYASIAAEESAFAQIMGDYAGTAQKKLQAVSDATGVTSTRLTGAMTSLTAKFKGLGYNVEDATTLATDGLLIASDAAAFWDMSLEESMSHLNSFINGSYEGGEAIGLFANDTQMAAYAVEKGIVADAKAWASLDEATKQATRLDYAKNMQQQSGATGQAAKEASSYANVMANLKEHWRQFQGVVGKPILEKFVLPAMQKLEKFMPKLTESVTAGIDWLAEGFDKIASYFSEVFTEDGLNMDALPDALTKMFRDVGRKIPRMLSTVGHSISSAWENVVWPAVQGAFKAVLGIDLPTWGELEKSVKDWWDGGDGIKASIASACNWALNLFGEPATVTKEKVSEVLETWWNNTKTLVQGACTWVLGLFSAPEDGEDGKTPASIIEEWWAGVVGAVQGACVWFLGLFQPPKDGGDGEDTPASIIETWWAGVVDAVQGACTWVLNVFGGVAGDALKVVNDWWGGVKKSIEDAIGIDLPDVDIAGIFSAGETAINSLITTAQTLVNDILVAVSSNPSGEIVLSARLSGLFAASVDAIAGLLGSASMLVANIVGSITGNQEQAEQIGGVFKDLFGVAGEVISGVVDEGIIIFKWFMDNGQAVGAAIGVIAYNLATFAAANPAIAVLEALGFLVGAMVIDWENFEKNYPHLVTLFEDITKLDFTDVATSMTTFQNSVQSLVDFISKNEGILNTFLLLLGGFALYSGNHKVGVALLAAGGIGTYNEVKEDVYDPEGLYADYPNIEKAKETGDFSGLTQEEMDVYNWRESPISQFGRLYAKGYEIVGRTLAMGMGGPMPMIFGGMLKDYLGEQIDKYMSENNPENDGGDEESKTPLEREVADFLGMYNDLNGAGKDKLINDIATDYNVDAEQVKAMFDQLNESLESTSDWFETLSPHGNNLPGDSTGQTGLIGTLAQVFSTVKADITAAAQEGVAAGMSGVTITGHITTGDVTIDGKTTVGHLFPQIDLKLGWQNGLAGRGSA